MPRLPIPRAHWPKNGDDFISLGERLGGTVSMVIAHRKVNADGKKGPPAFVEFWLEFPKEFVPPTQPPAPTNPLARDFLRDLAKVSAKAWVNAAKQSKGR